MANVTVRLPQLTQTATVVRSVTTGGGTITIDSFGPLAVDASTNRYVFFYLMGAWASGDVSWSFTGSATEMLSGDNLVVRATVGAGDITATATIYGETYQDTVTV